MEKNVETKEEVKEITAEVIERPKIRTIGSTEVGGTQEGVAEEDVMAKLDEVKLKKEVRARMIKTFNTQLIQVEQELKTGKTLDDMLDEIKNKKSKLPKMARDFVENFESKSILEMIDQRNEYLSKKQTTRIGGIVRDAQILNNKSGIIKEKKDGEGENT